MNERKNHNANGIDLDGAIQVLSIAIPPEAQVKLPDPDLLNYYNEKQERAIYIDSEIDDDTYDITKQIYEYNRQDKDIPVEERKPIRIYINSFGGDLHQCFALISAIGASKTPVYTINTGVAMSAGMIILLSGHKRFAVRYSIAMCHQGQGGTSGTYEEVQTATDNYKKMVENMKNYILERTNIDAKTLGRKWTKDWYMFADEQVLLGVVDKIVNDLSEVI